MCPANWLVRSLAHSTLHKRAQWEWEWKGGGVEGGWLAVFVLIKMPKSGKQSQSSDALTSASASASCVDAALMARQEKPKTSMK